MGMYTELHYNVELKPDTPPHVIDTLKYMLDELPDRPDPPKHRLFETERWAIMLKSGSVYFAADTHSTLRLDDITNQYVLCVRCNLKNYDGEIEAFTDWMDPWVDALEGDFLGFSRYEESEDPVIIRKC